jgi:hypothetical protein
MRAEITTVGELVAAMTAYPPDTQVRLAVAPGYPQATTIGLIACSPEDAERDGREPDLNTRTGRMDRRRNTNRLPTRDRP